MEVELKQFFLLPLNLIVIPEIETTGKENLVSLLKSWE